MTNIDRIRVQLTGFVGGPGVATFYALNGTTAVPQLRTMWSSLAAKMPSVMAIKVISAGDTIDDVTGDLVGAWSIADAAGVQGVDAAAYPAPAGACIAWLTTTILDGKRVKGRTFLVPLGGGSYQSDGSINPANVTAITNAAAAYVTASVGNAVVWHRPRAARAADGSRPAVTARAGGNAVITSAFCVDKTMVLTSRRD